MSGGLGVRAHIQGGRVNMRDIDSDCTYDYRYPLCMRL